MKYVFTFLAALLLTTGVFAQSPEKMSYQAVIRNSSDALVTNKQTGMQISILQGTVYGAAIYVETQTPTTNANGLLSVEIGDGTVLNGDFSSIDWSNGPYYIKTETDPAGGSNYSITGISQLLSVPYALHAKTAETVIEADPIFSASEAVNITANDITNLGNLAGTNTGDQDISGIATNGQAIQDTASQIRADIPDVSGFLTSETDPVYGASAASGITSNDTTNWNTAFGWGDHAGLYRSFSWVPSWTDVTEKPSVFPPSVHAHSAVDISTGTLAVARGGTGIGSYTTGNYIRATGETTLEQRTPAQVRTDIGAGTVSSIGTGNGIAGGTITTTGTLGLTGQALALHNLGTNGIIARTGAGAVSARTITAGTGITVTNGNGVSGNPAIAAKSYFVGEFAHGGIVFWVDATGQHGLVCAKEDQSTGVRWSAGTYGNTQAKGDGPFAGKANTSIIIAAQVAIGDDGATYAARICNELQVTEGGINYGDWYLPSKEELNLMFQNKEYIDGTARANGGSTFNIQGYWSSTENTGSYAWNQFFSSDTQLPSYKDDGYRVRAVRAF